MITDHNDLSPAEVIEILRRVDLFKGLPEEELRSLAEAIKGITAGPGDQLFAEGDEDDKFYVVATGAVEISKEIPGGGEERLAVRRGGAVFGEMALLNDAPRSATATVTEECECLTLSRPEFERLMGGDSFAFRMLKVLSNALRAIDIRFVNLEREGSSPTPAPEQERVVAPERIPPKVPGFDVAVGLAPDASGVESSTWEALRFSDDRVALLALAAQGHRVPPYHQLAVARAFFTELSLSGEPAETLLQRVNDSLYRSQVQAGDRFVGAGMLVPQGDTVLWSNAGGIQGAILRKDGTVTEFPDHGPPLGMMAGFQHEAEEISIDSGDMILVMTDASRGFFRGAVHAVTSLRGTSAGEVAERVQQAIRGARESDPDGATVLFLRRR